MIKIAIIGTHCTGKTTMCKELMKYLKECGFKVNMIGEVVRDCPYPVNEGGGVKSQRWMINEQIKREKQNEDCDFLICDRSVLDNYIYLCR